MCPFRAVACVTDTGTQTGRKSDTVGVVLVLYCDTTNWQLTGRSQF